MRGAFYSWKIQIFPNFSLFAIVCGVELNFQDWSWNIKYGNQIIKLVEYWRTFVEQKLAEMKTKFTKIRKKLN